jgi:hypothetical protein
MLLAWLKRLFKTHADTPQDNSGAAKPSATVPSTELAESRTSIRDTTKWMVAGAGAVAALVVAGLQLTNLPQSVAGRAMGLIGFGLAITGVGMVIVQGAEVLAVGYTHIGELADLKVEASRAKAPATPRLKPLAGIPLDQFVNSMDTELKVLSRGETDDVSDLYGKLMNSYDALRGLRNGQLAVTVSGQGYTKQDVPLLTERAGALELAAQQLISFSNQRVAEASFKRLKKRVVLGGGILAVGAALFALASTAGHPVAVTMPTAVVIYPAQGTTAFGKDCTATSLDGVAIGGDWERPVVTFGSSPNCPSHRLTVTGDIGVVVPVAQQAQGGTP